MSGDAGSYREDDLIFVPLGGAGEIGSNVNVYEYKGERVLIDCGSGFADEDMPGVDMLAPDVKYLQGKKVSGIVITHAHEDHIGGLPYVMKQLRYEETNENGETELVYPTIYGSKFTVKFLHEKLCEFDMQDRFNVVEVNSDDEVDLGVFKLKFVYMCHSAPDMFSVVLETDKGKVFHTADWKFDKTPPVIDGSDNEYGPTCEVDKLKALGEEGKVLAVISDSTNIFSPGRSESESVVYDDLFKVFSEEEGMVCVPLFASNVFRIATIVKAAENAGRRVAYTGRSLNRIIKTSKACDYLKGYEFLQDSDVSSHPRRNTVLLCTGCQGEVMAATSKLADGLHKCVSLGVNDVMLFSSKIIPGNEKRIFTLFNKFACLGVKLYTEQTHKVHVSGHPNRDDIKELYEMIKPQVVIPVHGYHVHMFEHVKFAKEECGIHAFKVSDGDIVKIDGQDTETVNKVPITFYGIDGKMLYQPQNPVMIMRRKLQRSGVMVIVALVYPNRRDKSSDGKGKGDEFFVKTLTFSPGILDKNNPKHEQILNDITRYIDKTYNNICYGNSKHRRDKNKGYDSKVQRWGDDGGVDNAFMGDDRFGDMDNDGRKKGTMSLHEMRKQVRSDVMRYIRDMLEEQIGKVPYIDMYIENCS